MKPEIHPTYYPESRIVCACGTEYTVGATQKELHVEICAACHPFFTGEQRIVDTAGQVERFMRRLEVGATQRQTETQKAEARKQAEIDAKRQRRGLNPMRAGTATEAVAETESES